MLDHKAFINHIKSYDYLKDFYYVGTFKKPLLKRHRRQLKRYGFTDSLTWNVDYSLMYLIHFLTDSETIRNNIKQLFEISDKFMYFDKEYADYYKWYELIITAFINEKIGNKELLVNLFIDLLGMYKRVTIIDLDYHKLEFEGQSKSAGYWLSFILELGKSNSIDKNDRVLTFMREYVHFFWW